MEAFATNVDMFINTRSSNWYLCAVHAPNDIGKAGDLVECRNLLTLDGNFRRKTDELTCTVAQTGSNRPTMTGKKITCMKILNEKLADFY